MIGNASFHGSASVAAALLLGIGTSVAPSAAFAAGRVALVVGNGAYAEIGTLPNPGNDAADVAAALGRLGFEVETVRDADRASMNAALRGFTRRSVGADVALVFYAGHGLEMDGVNYLVPVDARLERDTDVRFEAVALDDVLASVEGAALRLVILDACRNNPLARSMQLTSAARSVSRGSFGELNEDLLGVETLVAYAAAAGTTAADGTGRNSPYTAALLSFLEQPLELSALFRRVRGQVLDTTSGAQRPARVRLAVGRALPGGRVWAGNGDGGRQRVESRAGAAGDGVLGVDQGQHEPGRSSRRTCGSFRRASSERWRRSGWRRCAARRRTRRGRPAGLRGRCSGTARPARRWWWSRRAASGWAACRAGTVGTANGRCTRYRCRRSRWGRTR